MQNAKRAALVALLCCSSFCAGGDHASQTERGLALTIGPNAAAIALSGTASSPRPAFKRLALSGRHVAWQPAHTKAPVVVTYAVLSKDLATPDAINCSSMKPPAFALKASGISEPAFRRELEAAFAIWSEAAAIDFEETTDEARAAILVGAEATPIGHAFTNVTTSSPGSDGLSKALVCLSPGSRWKIGFDGNLDVYDLRYTLAHEIGHAIGLDHPSREGHLMSYRYVETRRGLSEGDRAGVVALYGARAR